MAKNYETTDSYLFVLVFNGTKDIAFSAYSVNSIFKGHPASIAFTSNPLAIMYKTRITKTYHSDGLNFAGHYCLVWWGCGSDCQHVAIVDLQTGIVYDGPTAARGFKFKPSSRLVIINPPDANSKINNDCAVCKPEFWVWNEAKRSFSRIK